MNCRRIRETFSQYLDKRLSPARRGIVARHLVQCRRCRAELEALVDVTRRLATARVPASDPGFWDALYTRLRAEARPSRSIELAGPAPRRAVCHRSPGPLPKAHGGVRAKFQAGKRGPGG